MGEPKLQLAQLAPMTLKLQQQDSWTQSSALPEGGAEEQSQGLTVQGYLSQQLFGTATQTVPNLLTLPLIHQGMSSQIPPDKTSLWLVWGPLNGPVWDTQRCQTRLDFPNKEMPCSN